MKKITLLGLVAILAIGVEGCSLISEFFASDDKETTPPKSSTTAQKLPETQNQSKEAKKDSDTYAPQRVSGLIPATNPDVRVSGSIRGRQDPFALVSIQPQIEEIDETEGNGEPKPPRSRDITGVPTIDSLNDRAKNSELVLAERAIVTGIVKLGGITKIIVKAPDEAYTRHVGIGEYVSNGQVLVKRVEGLNSVTPKVVLEQRGVEITKGVGEQPTTEEDRESEITAQGINELHSRSLDTAKTWLPNFLSEKLKDSKNN